jgi:hypothetical protein
MLNTYTYFFTSDLLQLTHAHITAMSNEVPDQLSWLAPNICHIYQDAIDQDVMTLYIHTSNIFLDASPCKEWSGFRSGDRADQFLQKMDVQL